MKFIKKIINFFTKNNNDMRIESNKTDDLELEKLETKILNLELEKELELQKINETIKEFKLLYLQTIKEINNLKNIN